MRYLKVIWENKRAIHNIAVHKLKAQYAEQAFGIGWAIVNPLVYVFSFWFFFTIGIKGGGDVLGFPKIVWLFPGVLAYRQVASYINSAPKIIGKNKMLVKTIKFPVMTLPVIEILKELYVHIIVMLIMFVIYSIVGFTTTHTWAFLPDIYYLNFIYYWFVMLVFGVGVSLILCPIGVLIKDTKNLVSAIMQPMFWLTPVLFPVEGGISPFVEKVEMLLNPLYFFVRGYRETMVYDRFFFESPLYQLYMWCIIVVIYIIGIKVWKKTRELMPDLI